MRRLFSVTVALLSACSVLAATRSVRTAAELDAAAANALAGDEIVLQAGTYQLTRTVTLTKSNLVLRGATGQREDVILVGSGMNTRGVDEGISVNASGITIRDLSVAEFYFNGIHTRAELNVDRCTISNVKTLNIGERHIKGSRDANSQTKMSDDFVIERVWMVQTKPRSGHPDTSPDYIGGIDMMAMNNLIIRDCRADGIVGSANGGNAAIFLWQGIRNVLIERNQIVGCAKGIALGNPAPPAANLPTGAWHADGAIIRNNMILRGTWTTGNNIVLELASSRNVACAYNTFYSSQADYFRVISFSESPPGKIEGVTLKYNLVRGRIFDQTDGAGWMSLGNLLDGSGAVITPQWFLAPLSGDLHLTPAATRALDAGMLIPDIIEDFDQERRPDGLQPDLGADELNSADADFDTIPDRAEIAPAPYRPGIDDRTVDSDSDGANNTHEYYAGTDPLDPGSILKLLEPTLRDTEFAFKVPTKTGWRFDIQYTELNAPLQWRTVSTMNGNGSVLEVTDAIQPGGRAYRVQTQPLSSN